MDIIRSRDISNTNQQFYRHAPYRMLLMAAFSAAVLAIAVQAIRSDNNLVLAIMFALMACLFLYFSLEAVIRSIKPGNWILRISADGIYINLRSYLNSHFPKDDKTVAFIRYSAIDSVHRVTKYKRNPQVWEYLSVKLKNTEMDVLNDALQNEYSRVDKDDKPNGNLGRVHTQKGSYIHTPLLLDDKDNSLLLIWKGAHQRTQPGIQNALDRLSKNVQVTGKKRKGPVKVRKGQLLMGRIFLSIGIVFLLWNGWVIANGLLANQWPTTVGMITSSGYDTSSSVDFNGSPYTTYTANIRYSYTVNGNNYSSQRVYFSDIFNFGESASRAVMKYPRGETVQVYYNPDDPAIALLEKGISTMMLIFMIMAFAFSGAGILFILG